MQAPSIDDRLLARERPAKPPAMFQRWSELLFLHWEIAPAIIEARLPPGLQVDLHEGKTYLGLVPFYMQKVRPRFLPCVPGLSNFLELNVRVYVHDHHGRPGVWFFSLDCNQAIAVELARRFFHLPYEHAAMQSSIQKCGTVNFSCRRKSEETKARYQYQGVGPIRSAEPGSLEFFLLERYHLFSSNRKNELFCGQVHHSPYPFQEALVEEFGSAPLLWDGLQLEGPPISALYCKGVDVGIHPLRSVIPG